MVPVSGVVQVGGHAMADRYAYVPLIGVFVAIVWGAEELAGRFELKRVWRTAATVAGVYGSVDQCPGPVGPLEGHSDAL